MKTFEETRSDYGRSSAFAPAMKPIPPSDSTGRGERLWLLWNHRQFLAKAFMVGVLAGTLIAFLLPREYESTVQLMPPDNKSNTGAAMIAAFANNTNGLTGNSGMVNGLANELLGTNTTGALFSGILRSRTVQDRLVKRFDLKRVYGVSLDEDSRKILSDRTGVSEDHKSGIITLKVIDRDRGRARAVAQAYVDELGKLVVELSTSAAHRERVFLEERLQSVKKELDEASKGLSEFASKNKTIDIKEQGRAMVEAAAALQGQLIVAESQLKELQQIYTPNNVRVRGLQARVNELHHQLESLGGKEGDNTQEGKLGNSEDVLYPSIRELPILGVTYTDWYRRTKIREAVYEGLTREYEMAKVEEAKAIPSVKVLDAASMPERKVFPPRALIIFGCSLVGLALGCFWVIGEARWQQIDEHNLEKTLAREVYQTFSEKMRRATPHGWKVQEVMHRIRIRLSKKSHVEPDEMVSDFHNDQPGD